jgi:hypothetical protein
MTRDRAGAVATKLVGIFVAHLRSGIVRNQTLESQIATLLRDEFTEIAQQTLHETRVEDPHE